MGAPANQIPTLPAQAGIVLRAYASGEADLVLRVLTKEQGKISILAKYARSNSKRFSGRMDVFDCGNFEYAKGRSSLLLMRAFQPSHIFRGLRENLDKITCASFMCECVDLLVKEGVHESEHIFEVLTLALQAIDEANSSKQCLRASFLALREVLGLTGFLDIEQGHGDSNGSVHRLQQLMEVVERVSEKGLATRSAMTELMQSLKSA